MAISSLWVFRPVFLILSLTFALVGHVGCLSLDASLVASLRSVRSAVPPARSLTLSLLCSCSITSISNISGLQLPINQPTHRYPPLAD